jgi:GntR family transcriptional regulator, transcriptional repressor for pyruvate dehydrogenase complex
MGGQTSTDAIIAEIKGLIQSGEFPPGSRFLSERELVSRFGVSRPTIRQALGSLSQMGVLEARQGAGTVVARTGENVLRAPFELLMLLEQPTLHELYEVRELVEVHLAGRAAERRTPDDLVAMEAALAGMRQAVTDPDRMTDPNLRFHMAIAAAAHLPLLERFMACLHDGIRTCIEATRPGVQDWIVSYEIHERIYDAIRQRRGTDARRAMILHMAMALDELRRLGVTEEGTGHAPARMVGAED